MSRQSNRGKEAKDDVLFGNQARLIFEEALQDLHYLLTRNYSEKNALQTVGTRYKLTQRQIRAIQSMAASEEQLTIVKNKAVSIENLKGKDLALDGFNVIILLESLFSNAYLFKGLDGCYRDLSSVHGTYKKVTQTTQALDSVVGFYKKQEIGSIVWIFDKPVSNSGRIKKMIEELATKENLNWTVILENNADQFIIDQQKITVSSDAFILRNCFQWFNFIGYLIEEEKVPATVFGVDF